MTHVEEKWTPADRLWLQQLREVPVIAVMRVDSWQQAQPLAQVTAQAGIRFIEIALSSPGSGQEQIPLLHHLHQAYPQLQIGAGTVLTPTQTIQVIEAGAQFVVSPFLDAEIIKIAQTHQIPVIPGALTPTEIWQAHRAGATAIKVFPIASVGGAEYLHHLRKPLGSLPLIPTGGVTLANAAELLRAGAIGVGIGGELFPPAQIRSGDWSGIETRLRQWVLSLTSRAEDAASV